MTITGTLVHLDSRDLVGRLCTATNQIFLFRATKPVLKAMSAHFGEKLRVDIDARREVYGWESLERQA